jgi:hypothetical protein
MATSELKIDLEQFYPEAKRFVARISAATEALVEIEKSLCPQCDHRDFCKGRRVIASGDGMLIVASTASTATIQAWENEGAPCQDPNALKKLLVG